VDWLRVLQVLWPIAVVVASLVLGAGFLWLKTQLPTKTDLGEVEKRLTSKIDAHDERLDRGGEKIADIDKRLAVVEEDCESQPGKAELNQGITVLAGRMSGVESGLRGVEKALSTQNSYVMALVEQGLRS